MLKVRGSSVVRFEVLLWTVGMSPFDPGTASVGFEIVSHDRYLTLAIKYLKTTTIYLYVP